jgi:hypothetical protein
MIFESTNDHTKQTSRLFQQAEEEQDDSVLQQNDFNQSLQSNIGKKLR